MPEDDELREKVGGVAPQHPHWGRQLPPEGTAPPPDSERGDSHQPPDPQGPVYGEEPVDPESDTDGRAAEMTDIADVAQNNMPGTPKTIMDFGKRNPGPDDKSR